MGNIANIINYNMYHEGEGISFVTAYKVSSQWPCEEWFHIPTQAEAQSVLDILTTLKGSSLAVSDLQTYLFLPPVWYIDRQTGQQASSYWVIRVWTCTFVSEQVYIFKDDTNWVEVALDRPATWIQIRPFSNQGVIPDSSWTTLLSSGDASLSVNHPLGLISLTADWDEYITLSDKNLGATTYYDWTVTASNTWYYYQSWNNHGFTTPITNTSNTKVNTTGYWPWNYYDSETFICGSDIRDWRTRSNDNLWWGIGIASGVSIGVDNSIIEKLPDAPTTDGTYKLTCTVSSWVATYSWEA